MTEIHLQLRASGVPAIQRCPRQADAEERAEDIRRAVPVATEFGTMVHALVTGQEHEPAELIQYDEITASRFQLDQQASSAAVSFEHFLDQWTVIDRETELTAVVKFPGTTIKVIGHLDLLCIDGDRTFVVDLKTGRYPPEAYWTQMSIYAWLAEVNEIDIDDVTMLVQPRGSRDLWCTEHTRPARTLSAEAVPIIREIAAMHDTPRPGLHCKACQVPSCPFHPAWSHP